MPIITIDVNQGILGVTVTRQRDSGQCIVTGISNPSSQLEVGDIILNLNGIDLETVDGGVKAWEKLFSEFQDGNRKLKVQRRDATPMTAPMTELHSAARPVAFPAPSTEFNLTRKPAGCPAAASVCNENASHSFGSSVPCLPASSYAMKQPRSHCLSTSSNEMNDNSPQQPPQWQTTKLPESPTPQELAKAIFCEPIYGPAIIGNVTQNDSHAKCLQEMMVIMRRYNFHPALITNKKNLTKIRKLDGYSKFAYGHNPFQTARSCHVVCKNCFNDDPNPEEWGLSVIGTATHAFVMDDNESSAQRSQVTVTAIYPHSAECTTPENERTNFRFSTVNGGGGWVKLPFDHDEIIRQTYDTFTKKLSNTKVDGNHYGKMSCLLIFAE